MVPGVTIWRIRYMATRLLLIRALQLMSEPEVQLWRIEVNRLLEEFGASDQPGSPDLVASIEEYVQHLDFIRRELG